MRKEIEAQILGELTELGVRGTFVTTSSGRHRRKLVVHCGGRDIRIPLPSSLGRDRRQWQNFRSQLRRIVTQ